MGRGENNLLYGDSLSQGDPYDFDDIELYTKYKDRGLIDRIQSDSLIMFWEGLKEAGDNKREDILEYLFRDKQKTADIIIKLSKVFETNRITTYIDNDSDVFMLLDKTARGNVPGAEKSLLNLLDREYISEILAIRIKDHFHEMLAKKRRDTLFNKRQILLLESFTSLEENNPVIRYKEPLSFVEHRTNSNGQSKTTIHLTRSDSRGSLCGIQLKAEHESAPLTTFQVSEFLDGKISGPKPQTGPKPFLNMEAVTCNSCKESFSKNPDIFKKDKFKEKELPYILNRTLDVPDRRSMARTILKRIEKGILVKEEVSKSIINNNLKILSEESKYLSDLIYRHQGPTSEKLFDAEDIQKVKNITHFSMQTMTDEVLESRIKSLPKLYTFG